MSDISNTSYRLLVKQLQASDEAAFEKVYDLMASKIYHFVKLSIKNKEDAQEITQEVFIKLWNERERIDSSKSLQSFLYVIAKNKINDHLRKVLNEKKYLESIIHSYNILDDDLVNIIDFRDTEKVILKLISMLPERRRQVFELSRFKGYTYKEISKELGISENTVDTQIRKALANLKEGLLRLSIYLLLVIGGII
ncbi:RNA polymerase sigma factor [Saccharicrinis aurantiacus]|uniref:RNA polymerase sigma factor n=1 Tax=Saccharicrinis aurantiacus TaxID=1849719 RepID=UPI0024937344|nr:RNA polymerase sigma-70 factor [Saccharicrinis aurantiacus]